MMNLYNFVVLQSEDGVGKIDEINGDMCTVNYGEKSVIVHVDDLTI